jgi:hypothetical protein
MERFGSSRTPASKHKTLSSNTIPKKKKKKKKKERKSGEWQNK